MPEEGGVVFPLILSNPPPVYGTSFGFLYIGKGRLKDIFRRPETFAKFLFPRQPKSN